MQMLSHCNEEVKDTVQVKINLTVIYILCTFDIFFTQKSLGHQVGL